MLAATATHTVYMQNDQLIVEELSGEYARIVYDAATLGFQSVSDAILNGDLLTMLYRDADDQPQTARLNWRTGEILPACPLTITALGVLENHDPHILGESGNAFLPLTAVSYSCTLSDNTRVYYIGDADAALAHPAGELVRVVPLIKFSSTTT